MDKRWDLVPKLMYEPDKIKDRISFQQAFEYYTNRSFPPKGKNTQCLDSTQHKNGDKTPSMSVLPDKGYCYCFACQKKWNVFDLAAESKGLNVKSEFWKVCETICNDFGIDIDTVSNRREREEAIQKIFGKNQDSQQKYTEYFPFLDRELEVIGLSSLNGRQEIKFPVPAEEYYCHFNNCKPEELPQRVKKRLTDKDGKPAMIQATYDEMVEMGYSPKLPDKREKIETLWKADKESTEQMIIDKCVETTNRLSGFIENLQTQVESYAASHDLNAESAFVKECVAEMEDETLNLSGSQQERLNDFQDYKSDLNKIETYRGMLSEVEGVYDKINTFIENRLEHETANKSKSVASPNLPE